MLWQLGAQAAWGIETTAKNMVGVAEYYIPRLDSELQRLLALVEEGNDLSLRQVKHMASCLAPKTL